MAEALWGSRALVPGLRVGHFTDLEALTGSTVVLVEEGAVGAVDVRGAAPGTRETDLLSPENTVEKVQAILLTGGSAFGLRAADGVVRYLAERGKGFPTPGGVVPIVPAAVLYDLGRGKVHRPPGAEAGYQAALAVGEEVEEGSVGAGTGAVAGGVKGGVGLAGYALEEGYRVMALVAVNSLGRPFDPLTGRLYGEEFLAEGERALLPDRSRYWGSPEDYRYPFLLGQNTTLAVVATDAPLSKAQARRLAIMAQDGIARAIRPAHTPLDGDLVFALALGEGKGVDPYILLRLGAYAADAVTRAILRAVLLSGSAPGIPAYRDLMG
ncbi:MULTISPECIES: P1 family peptidase [Thermus]|uniref:Endo-type 6-aminohexanoate oligomer hydrolase n=5 Tax=Thermus scotoductus TaxID=37636 RepID=E8PLX2_THESS|nr:MULTISPECIES: P1 family peptidase [Thermus]ADW22391.1 endo-type 6-aminohexanoate oligomer hydrolase [Thermus scotoductus SA-01]